MFRRTRNQIKQNLLELWRGCLLFLAACAVLVIIMILKAYLS